VGLPPEAAIAKEEFFGPVAMIFPFKTKSEAIHLANITAFGLSAAVCSRDLVRARRVAGEIESGMVFIYDFTRSDPRAPFGGVRVWARTGCCGRTETYQPKTDLAGRA
jgi:acyl-CoA reductase-like NAD-dependent aldehyde dehydrogenase